MSDRINPEGLLDLKHHVQPSVINTSAPARKEREKHPEMETEKKKPVLTNRLSTNTNPAEARIQLKQSKRNFQTSDETDSVCFQKAE